MYFDSNVTAYWGLSQGLVGATHVIDGQSLGAYLAAYLVKVTRFCRLLMKVFSGI